MENIQSKTYQRALVDVRSILGEGITKQAILYAETQMWRGAVRIGRPVAFLGGKGDMVSYQ